MRKTLEIAALALLFVLWGMTAWAVLGPHPLPARIPTHFNAAGRPDGWGTPAMLWALPVIAVLVYGLMLLASRHPRAFRFSPRALPAQRRQMENVALGMIAWLEIEVVGLFAWIQWETIRFARLGEGTLPVLFLPAALVVIFATIAWHLAGIRRAARWP